jgi:hypothetical protein
MPQERLPAIFAACIRGILEIPFKRGKTRNGVPIWADRILPLEWQSNPFRNYCCLFNHWHKKIHMEKPVINPSLTGILSFRWVYQMAEILTTKSSTYPRYTESSNKWMNSVTQMNSVTWISLDIYFLFHSIGKHHNEIQPKCLAMETYGTTLCIGPLLTICVSFHPRTHKDLASLQTPKHFHVCPLCKQHIALVC